MKKMIVSASFLIALINAAAAAGNLSHSFLMDQSEAKRAKLFGEILTESGKACVGTKTFFQGKDSENSAYWSVRCDNGKEYQVLVPRSVDAKTRAMECELLKVMGLSCWKRY